MFKRGEHTIKGKVLKISLAILFAYALGLMVIIGGIFPERYMELQKQLNMDILTNANQCLSAELENIYREYENLMADEEVVKALEDSRSWFDTSKVNEEYRSIRYKNAQTFLEEKRETVLFLSANSIAELVFMVEDPAGSLVVVGESEVQQNERLMEYLTEVGEDIVFFSMAQFSEDTADWDEFAVCLPVFDDRGERLGSICFWLNREKEYVLWGDDALILINKEREIMFCSGNIQGILPEDVLSAGDDRYEKDINGIKYLAASTELRLYDWEIVHLLSTERLQNMLNETIIFAVCAIVAVLFLALLLMGSLSRMICYNIETVTSEMDSFLGKRKRQAVSDRREKRWNELSNRLSMNQKLWMYYGVIIILPMILVSMVVYSKCQHTIRTEYEQNAQILSDYTYQIVENQLYDDMNTLKTVLVDTPLLENMYRYARSEDQEAKKQLYYDIGMRIQQISPDCEISYYDARGNFVLSWPNMEEQRKSNLKVTTEYNEKTVWNEYNHQYSFYMVRKIYMKSSEYVGDIGFLALQIHEDALFGKLKNMNSDIEYCFADKDNLIFASSSTEVLGTDLGQAYMEEKGMRYSGDLSQYGIRAFIIVSEEAMYDQTAELMWILLLWTLVCISVAIVEERRCCSDILDSVAAVNHALVIGEEIDLSVQKGDELDALIFSVDRMKDRINALIDELYEHEIITRELELKVFQAQITPHFLCNILEQINALIDMEDERAGTLVLLLGKFFRQGISQDKQLITLNEEIEYTRVYTQIHQIMLGEKLEVIWDIPEQMLSCRTVHFLLQPIIENSLKHGQYMKNDYRRIIVRGYERGDSIIIGVSDNGAGISKEKLSELRESLQNKKSEGKSKGLKNVHARLRLTFGEHCGIRIYSVENKGVYVYMKLPKEL
ncbi:MAG: histidine kinase [Lachnospiraceae bacterium]|nr:histidine kinase [Lachnospiraceae bacterium]